MGNTFSDDPRRVAYDKNRTLKKTLENWYTVCFLLLAGCGALLTLFTAVPAIIAAAGGKPLGLITLLLVAAGGVCGTVGCHKRNNPLCVTAVLAFAAVCILERSAYFMIYSGAAAAVFCLNRRWAELERAEGFPDFNYEMVMQEQRIKHEREALAALIPDRPVSDLTVRNLPQTEPAPAEKPAFRPGEMDSI